MLGGMDAIEAQKELVQFLLKRLRGCALESAAFRAAIFNFSEDAKKITMDMVESYRKSAPIQQRLEREFQDLDSLIQQVNEGLHQEEIRKLLEKFPPTGLPN